MDRAHMQIPQMARDSLEDQLHSAILIGDTSSTTSLLCQGANVNFICLSGKTLLGIAAEKGNIAILRILLDARIDGKVVHDSVSEVSDKNEFEVEGAHELTEDMPKVRRRKCKDYNHRSKIQNHTCTLLGKSKYKVGLDHHKCQCICNHCVRETTVGLPLKSDSMGVEEFNSPVNYSPTGTESTDSSSSDSCHKQNLGYFVVIHNDGESFQEFSSTRTVDENWNSSGGTFAYCALNDIKTPDGMDKLEWDEEVKDGENNDGEEDSFASQYRWYADILDKTSSLLQPPQRSDINHQDIFGRCAVHYAAEKGFTEVIQLLISAGCRVDVGDSHNLTPLHLSVVRDYPDVARLLLEAGANVNCKTSDRSSALHYAASRGFVETVEVLLGAGAKVDSLDASDRTPLMVAVSREHDRVVEILIENGAKVNIEEIHGYTPLCEAVWQKAVPIVQLLLKAGAKITQSHFLLHYAVLHRHVEMAELLVKAGSIVNLRDDTGSTPLSIAALAGHCQLAELLLNHGASANYPNSISGSTPLHEAVEQLRECEYPKFEQLFHVLRLHRASMNVQTCTIGDTPLYRAVLLDKYQAAVLLVRHGTDVKFVNEDPTHKDILFIAYKRDHFALCRLIVHAGFDIYRCTPYLRPPYTNQDTDTIVGWLKYMKCNPLRLSDLSRLVIRRQLGEQVYSKISASGLPYLLKKFILLEDIDTRLIYTKLG